MKTLVIAEAGVNHNGDMALARQLIEVAAEAGADFVKFQTFQAYKLVSAAAPKAEYQKQQTDIDESQHAMLSRLELSKAMHAELIQHCKACAIRFFSTGFDLSSIDMLLEFGMDRIKVPSGEITNLRYLRHVGTKGIPVILSTGMATLGEIEAAIDALVRSGTPHHLITVLHCTTEYPTPMVDVNLRAMLSIQNAFKVNVGYSDHTPGIEVAIAATALGATVIEKHFTLDRTLPGPDHKASLEPNELSAMIKGIRNIEQAMGDGIKRPSLSEQKNIPVARKSLVASCAIKTGAVFCEKNMTEKRPGTGINPMRWDEVLGQRAKRDFSPDELIEL